MVVARWDPFRDLMSIQNELNRLFGRTYAGTESSGGTGSAWVPPLDIFETQEKYVEASFDKGVLTVEVPKAEQAKPKKITVKATA